LGEAKVLGKLAALGPLTEQMAQPNLELSQFVCYL
jgi:hypothetical protein